MRRIEKIETAVEPGFQDHFMKAIAIPHDDLEFPHLARVVTLPDRARDDGKARAATGGLSRRQLRKLRAAGKSPA